MWLLVGGDSEIGAATHAFLKERGIASAATTRRQDRVSAGRPFLDLSVPLGAWEPPPGISAACIFASVARISACEADPHGSAHVNVTQTVALADRLLARGIHTLLLSSNQVFDGSVPDVRADAVPAPTTEYGRQKTAAEAAFLSRMNRMPAAILRLSKVVSPGMPLFHGWLDALAAGRPIRCFRDMTLAPVETQVAVAAIAALLESGQRGIFQLTGPRDVSYAEAGCHLARQFGADPPLVEENSARDAGLPPGAIRSHTTLDSSWLRDAHGITAPDVSVILDRIVARYRAR